MSQPTTARVWVEIDLHKIKANYNKIACKVKPSKVMAVLKANAYGLGIDPIAHALIPMDPPCFGVAEPNEGFTLRKLGLRVQVLGGLLATDVPDIVEAGIIAPITDFQTAKLLSAEASKQSRVVECHFLIDSGMNRLGIPIARAEKIVLKTSELPGLNCSGIYSHFPHAYHDLDFSKWQLKQMNQLLIRLQEKGMRFQWIHIANSDAINNVPESYKKPYNLVRSGINLYGLFDPEGKQSLNLVPVLTLKATLIAIRKLEKGATVGYGRTATITKPTLTGTISIGYADGLPIALSNKGHVLLKGNKCPILGRVSMDYTTISIDAVPDAKVGDEVVCLGQTIPVNEWASQKKSIPYDIICSLGNRVKRHYMKSQEFGVETGAKGDIKDAF